MVFPIRSRLSHRLRVAFIDETSLLEGRNRPIQSPLSTLNGRPPLLPQPMESEWDKILERLRLHIRYISCLLLMRGRDAF